MLEHIENIGETILLNGQPLSLVTRAGIEVWIGKGIKHSYRYDQVRDPLSGKQKYRCSMNKDGEDMPFVLIGDPDSKDGARVILFDDNPASAS